MNPRARDRIDEALTELQDALRMALSGVATDSPEFYERPMRVADSLERLIGLLSLRRDEDRREAEYEVINETLAADSSIVTGKPIWGVDEHLRTRGILAGAAAEMIRARDETQKEQEEILGVDMATTMAKTADSSVVTGKPITNPLPDAPPENYRHAPRSVTIPIRLARGIESALYLTSDKREQIGEHLFAIVYGLRPQLTALIAKAAQDAAPYDPAVTLDDLAATYIAMASELSSECHELGAAAYLVNEGMGPYSQAGRRFRDHMAKMQSDLIASFQEVATVMQKEPASDDA